MARHLAFSRCLAVAIALGMAGSTFAQPASGDLWVIRVGDGVTALSGTSAQVNLDRFTIAGAPLGSTNISGTVISLAGSSTSEGFLSRSTDGLSVTFGAYNAAPGTPGVVASAAQREVVQIDTNMSTSISLLGATAYAGGNIRSAITTNGVDYWTTGSNGGVQYHAVGSGTTSGQLSSSPTNTRVANIINGQLYTSSASSPFIGVSTIGTGLPTTTGQTATILPGFPATITGSSHYGYVGLDSPSNPVVGLDTLYVADDRTTPNGGIQRWVFDGALWAATGTATQASGGVRGLTATQNGNNVTLYATTTESNANRLVSINDLLAPGGGTFDPAFVTLATAPALTAFRGVSFAPVPEPTTVLSVCAIAGIAYKLRRRTKTVAEIETA